MLKFTAVLLLMLGLAGVAGAAGKTRAHLLLDSSAARAGDTVWAGVELKMPAHWHTYWRNSGDAGLPTMIQWTLPPGVTAGDIRWPLPEKSIFASGDLSIILYTYNDDVVLLVPLKLDARMGAGKLPIQASVSWLECNDSGVCVEGGAVVEGRLTIGAKSKPASDAKTIALWRSRTPQTVTNVQATARWENIVPGDERMLVIDWTTAGQPADFYPYENQSAEVQEATETLAAPAGHVRLRKMVKKGAGTWPGRITGVLVGTRDPKKPTSIEAILPVENPEPR